MVEVLLEFSGIEKDLKGSFVDMAERCFWDAKVRMLG